MRKILVYLQLAAAGLVLCLATPAFAQSPATPPMQTPAAAPKPQFLLKLTPPRPNFAATLTPHETEVMTAHAAYWADLFKTGKVLIIGPVSDPKGDWGMAVLQTTKEDAQQMADNDPSVKAGINTAEVVPMHVFLRKQ